jgi:hypothetical protein
MGITLTSKYMGEYMGYTGENTWEIHGKYMAILLAYYAS